MGKFKEIEEGLGRKLSIFEKVKVVGGNVVDKVKPHMPIILLVGGGACVVGGAIFLGRQVYKNSEIISDYWTEEAIDEREGMDRKEEMRLRIRVYLDFTKHLIVPSTIIASGVAMMIAARHIEHARYLAVSAAYDSLLTIYMQYRERVREELGDQKDLEFLYGKKTETIEETDKKGNVKEKVVDVLNDDVSFDIYSPVFSRYTSTSWENDVAQNYNFLKRVEHACNVMYNANGYMFLDEVYTRLGMNVSEHPEWKSTKILGWVKGQGDDYIDFGVFEYDEEPSTQLNEGDNSFHLHFNCDGVIIDKI